VHYEAFGRGQLLVCLYQSLVIRHLILLLAPFRCTQGGTCGSRPPKTRA
jgi:hypothetical protein